MGVCEICGQESMITTRYGDGPFMCSKCEMEAVRRFEVGKTYLSHYMQRPYEVVRRTECFISLKGPNGKVFRAKIQAKEGGASLSEYISTRGVFIQAKDVIE